MLIPKIKTAKLKTVKSKLLKIGLFLGILLFTTPQCWGMTDRFDYLSPEDQVKVLEIIEQVEIAYPECDTAAAGQIIAQLAPLLSPEDYRELLGGMLNDSLLNDNYDMAEIAIKLGADPNHILSNENISILISLAQNGSARAIDFLLKAGADPCQETQLHGFNHNALCAGFLNEKNFLPIAELLIPRVNVNCRVLGQATPLHMAACLPRRTTLTALLLEHHADPNAREKNDLRPLDVLFQDPERLSIRNLYKTALLLHTYGADITFETLPNIERHLTSKQLELMAQERGRRESDLVCIKGLCAAEQREILTFKELYKNALSQIIARFLTQLPTELAPIIADYATYDPVIDFDLSDAQEKEKDDSNYDSSTKVTWWGPYRIKKKTLKSRVKENCVIQ